MKYLLLLFIASATALCDHTLTAGQVVNDQLYDVGSQKTFCLENDWWLAAEDRWDEYNLCVSVATYLSTAQATSRCRARLIPFSNSTMTAFSFPFVGYRYCFCMSRAREMLGYILNETTVLMYVQSQPYPCNFSVSYDLVDVRLQNAAWTTVQLGRLDEPRFPNPNLPGLTHYGFAEPQYIVPAQSVLYYQFYATDGTSITTFGLPEAEVIFQRIPQLNGSCLSVDCISYACTEAFATTVVYEDERLQMMDLRNLTNYPNTSWVIRPQTQGTSLYLNRVKLMLSLTYCTSPNCTLPSITLAPTTSSPTSSSQSGEPSSGTRLNVFIFYVFFILFLFFS
jgi:hypothetical protein